MKWVIKEAVGKKTLDSNVFASSQEPSSQIETEVISSTIEDTGDEYELTSHLEEYEEKEMWQKMEREKRVTGYSVKGLNREVRDIIDSDIEKDIDLEYNRLKEHYDRTINHLLETL